MCRALQLVQQEERERVLAFRYRVDSAASLMGRLLLRAFAIQALGVENTQLQFQRTEKGKPFVVGGCGDWDYNVSHAGDWVVLAADIRGRCGVDTMRLTDSRVDRLDHFFRLMQRQFTASEFSAIRGTGQEDGKAIQLSRFFRNWSLKESYVKATGTGITVDLQSLNFLVAGAVEVGRVESGTRLELAGQPADWRFEESLLDEDHIVSVAVEGVSTETEIFTVLNIQQIFSLFQLKTEQNPDSSLLRKLDPADFLLFTSLEHPKPW